MTLPPVRSLKRDAIIKALLTLVLVAPVWLVAYPPLQDYPNHLARAYITLHRYDLGLPFEHYYALVSAPVPNSLGDILLVALGMFMPMEIAGKLLLSLLLVGIPLSFELFLSAARPCDAALYGYFGWVLAYNHLFFRGYMNYLLGVGGIFLTVWAYLKWWRTSKRRYILVAAILVTATSMAHALAFAVLILLVVVMFLGRNTGRERFLLSALAFLPAGVLLVFYWMGEHPPLTWTTYPDARSWAMALLQLFMAYDPPCDVLMITPVLSLWLGLLFLRIWHHRRPDVWLLSAGLLFLAALVMPRGINIMVRPGQRLLLVALLVGVAAFPHLARLLALFVRAFLILMVIAVSVRVATTYAALQPELERIATCVEALTPTAPTAHVVLTPYRGSIQPEKHFVEYAAIWKNAPVSNLFTSYSLLRLRAPLPPTRTLTDLNPSVYPQAVIIGPGFPPLGGYKESLSHPPCMVWVHDR